MAFNPRVITKELDFANLARHNDNYADIKTELDAHESAINTHVGAQTAHGSTAAATPGAIMQRDSAGRAKVAAPAAADDIARKAEVDAVQEALDYHIDDADVHLSEADRDKLDGIEPGAEPNQNAFAQVNNVVAASESDTLTIAGGAGITISTNPTTKTVTVTATGEATPGPHGSSHDPDGSDPIPELVALRSEFDALTPASIGAETPEGAQAKVDALAGEGNTKTVAEVAAQLADLALFANKYTSFAEALGDAISGTVYLPPGEYAVEENLTINSDITLQFANGAYLNIADGVTVTCMGYIDAGPYYIFKGNGVFKGRALNQDVYPEWWGAKGDLSVNCTDAFRKAIKFLGWLGGGRMKLGNGHYLYTPPLNIDEQGVTVVGNGPKATVLVGDSSNLDLIAVGNSPTIVGSGLRDLQIACTVDRVGGYAIRVEGCEYSTLENLMLFRYNDKQTGDGVYFGENSGLAFVRAIDCEIKGAFKALVINGGNDRYFSQLWFRGDRSTSSFGLYIEATQGDWFTDVESVEFDEGVLIAPGAGEKVLWVKFHNVLADSNKTRGWRFDGTGEISGIVLDSCWSSTNGVADINAQGVLINTGHGISFDNVRVFNNGGHGIEILANTKDVAINGGMISSNSIASRGVCHGVAVHSNHIGGLRITGVKIGQTAGQEQNQGFGILMQGGCDNYIVANNDLRLNVTGGLQNATTPGATRVVSNNIW